MRASRILAITLAGTVVITLLFFGSWQVQRLFWKDGLIEIMAARSAAPPMPLAEVLALPVDEQEWTPVFASGRLLPDASFALYRIGANGRPGYHILTPLVLEDGSAVLINRGMMDAESFKLALATMPGVPEQTVDVTGILRPGETPAFFTNDNDPDNEVWYWIELDLLADRAGVGLLPGVIYADADPAGADLRSGQARFDPPNRHLQYAITWYCLAAAAGVVFFLRLRRKPGGEKEI